MMRPLGAPDMAFMMGGAPMPLFPPIFRPVHVPVNQINTERIRIEVEISEIKKADEERYYDVSIVVLSLCSLILEMIF